MTEVDLLSIKNALMSAALVGQKVVDKSIQTSR